MNYSAKGERLFDGTILLVLALLCLAVIIPFWYIVVMSITPLEVWTNTKTAFFPPLNKITFAGYEQLLTSWRLPRSFGVSVFITLFGTTLNLLVTMMMAYPLTLPTSGSGHRSCSWSSSPCSSTAGSSRPTFSSAIFT